MHDAGKVLAGLVVFLAITTSPMWYHAVSGAEAGAPELRIASESRQCLAPTPYMRAFHMDMLDAWRDEAVRTSDTTYVGLDGKVYQKNLAGTCLGDCHSNKDEFCDRCHEYVGAEPYCWDCHGSPSDAL
jgi:hypothetical protein